MTEEVKTKPEDESPSDQELNDRRAFLRSLGRWSAIIIGTLTLGGLVAQEQASGWVNGGAAWVNGRGGGGGAGWANRAGGGGAWANGGRAWVNGAGGGSAGWVNRAGAGGGAWVNRRGY